MIASICRDLHPWGLGVVSSARTSARRSAQEGAKESPYLGWKVGLAKNVFGREGGLQTETSQEGHFPGTPTLPQSPMCHYTGMHALSVFQSVARFRAVLLLACCAAPQLYVPDQAADLCCVLRACAAMLKQGDVTSNSP